MDSGGESTWAHTESTMVKRGQTRRHLAASETRRGGGVRVSCSGDQKDDRACLREAGNEPHRLVAVVEPGVAGNVAGDDLGGRRSRVKMNPRLQGTARHVMRCVGLVGVRWS